MRMVFSVIKIRFNLLLQYRMAAIAGIVTQFFFGFVMIMVYEAFYKSSPENMPMTFTQTVTYVWLGQAFLSLLPWNGDREIQRMIKSGQVAYEFVRPVDLYSLWYARIFTQRITGTLLRCIPMIIVTGIIVPNVYSLQRPESISAFIMFLTSLSFAILLGCALSNIITISVLFTIGDGIDRLVPAIVILLSGVALPLPYFPEWSQPLLKILPFSGLVDGPYKFYIGIYNISDFTSISLNQIFWIIAFIIIGRWMINKAIKRVVIQGG